MENQMQKKPSRNRRFLLIIALIVAVAALVTLVTLLVTMQTDQFQRRLPPGTVIVGDFELFYVISTVISTLDIALLVSLLLIYLNIYNKTRSPFTIGLIIFTLALLFKDVTSSPFVSGLFHFAPYGLGPFVFLPGVFEFAALSVLLYLSVKY